MKENKDMKRIKTFALFENQGFNGGYYCSLWIVEEMNDDILELEIIMYAPSEESMIETIWEAMEEHAPPSTVDGIEELGYTNANDIKSISQFQEIIRKVEKSENDLDEESGVNLNVIENTDDFIDLLESLMENDKTYVLTHKPSPDEDWEILFKGSIDKMVYLFVNAFQRDSLPFQRDCGDQAIVLSFFFNQNNSMYLPNFRFIEFGDIWKKFSGMVQRNQIDEYLIRRLNSGEGIGFFRALLNNLDARPTLEELDPAKYSKTIAEYIAWKNDGALINKLKAEAPEIWQAVSLHLGKGADETGNLADLGF